MTIYIWNRSQFYNDPPSVSNHDVPSIKIVGAEHFDFSPIIMKFESLSSIISLRNELNKLLDESQKIT